MAIVIYTYSNPYKINREPYWAMVKNSFQICVSQTLVNGLCDQYKNDLFKGKVTTITRFVNNLFEDWESDVMAIRQRAAIDNVIGYVDFSEFINDVDIEDVINSLKRNRSYVLESVRIMFELGMDPQNIRKDMLTYEQKCVVAIYEELIRTNNPCFILKTDFSQNEIEIAINNTMKDALGDSSRIGEFDNINKDIVVVHGIHQYSPIMLRTIEVLSKYKNVIILFNYQQDYKNVYQTWLNVYSWFESKIIVSDQNFHNESQDFKGGRIADNMAAMIAGNTASIDFNQKIEVMEFDNQTEFAGYIATKFACAEKDRAEDNYAHPALYYMEEQLYSANSSVNDILKIYFPEQFGERNFLDYPIGHFFIAITNMWNPDTQEMQIRELNDVRECLSCGIITEKTPGELVSIFDKCVLYFSNETTINGIVKRLKKLGRRLDDFEDDIEEATELGRLEYFDLLPDEIQILSDALVSLNSIIQTFFEDFNNQENYFKRFYKKISDVLIKQVLDKDDLDTEFKDIVERVLSRLNEIKEVEASASFDCLRETMQLYLQQLPKDGKGANWIVRNFEQIDGDVLRKSSPDHKKVYHFACLSDQDMSITHRDEFPWPLNIQFFEIAQAPVDWKYQVYVTSRLEYKNFRRYALVYGLAFSKCDIKLSYIKNETGKEKDLYYLLKILNAKTVLHELEKADNIRRSSKFIDIQNTAINQFTEYDLMKYRLCKYRFLLESIIEEKTVYKDEFLLRQYLLVILEHRARKHFSGKKYVKNIVYSYLVDTMDELESDFPFINSLDSTDIVNAAMEYIEKHAISGGSFMTLRHRENDYMCKRENFLSVPSGKGSESDYSNIFKNSTQQEVDSELNAESLETEIYVRNRNILCEKCADKDVCLEIFRSKKH